MSYPRGIQWHAETGDLAVGLIGGDGPHAQTVDLRTGAVVRTYDKCLVAGRPQVEGELRERAGLVPQGRSYPHRFEARGMRPTALIVAGGSVFAAWRTSEQNVKAAVQPASGTIVRIPLAGGEEQQKLDVDSAVIVNGLMVAAGRLYAVHEDGTLRSYAP